LHVHPNTNHKSTAIKTNNYSSLIFALLNPDCVLRWRLLSLAL
jgi:hypothetical protein